MHSSHDGLLNVATGLGTDRSKRHYDQWQYNMMGDQASLTAAYQSSWLAQQIVDVPSMDATREWRTIKSKWSEDISAVEQALMVQSVIDEALRWARLYGGSGVIMLTGQDLSKPINLNRIKKGSLERLLVFDRWTLVAQEIEYTNPLSPNYLLPNYYTLYGGAQRIHWSHIVRFNGRKLPPIMRQYTHGWGASILEGVLSDVADMVAAKNGIAELMRECNVDTINVEDLKEQLASDQDDAIIKRYQTLGLMKSNIHMAILDQTEQLTRNTLNLSGAAQTLEELRTWISGAAKIPVTKLFGTSAKGLSATGDGDMKTYYDDVRSYQMSELRQGMRVLDEVMVRSAVGRWVDDFDYLWNPLAQPDSTETSTSQYTDAQKNMLYLDSGVVTVSQIRRNLQSSEEYQFDDEKLSELEDLEDANMFEELPNPEPVTDSYDDFINEYLNHVDQGMSDAEAFGKIRSDSDRE